MALQAVSVLLNKNLRSVPGPGVAMERTPGQNSVKSPERVLGTFRLSKTQRNELFRILFDRCHPYLPFKIRSTSETVFEKCPLVFWVTCAASSSYNVRCQLEPHIKEMIHDLLRPH
jgi:hypothetical protein